MSIAQPSIEVKAIVGTVVLGWSSSELTYPDIQTIRSPLAAGLYFAEHDRMEPSNEEQP